MQPQRVGEVVALHLGPLPPPQPHLALEEAVRPAEPVELDAVEVDRVQVGEHPHQLMGARLELVGGVGVELRPGAPTWPDTYCVTANGAPSTEGSSHSTTAGATGTALSRTRA